MVLRMRRKDRFAYHARISSGLGQEISNRVPKLVVNCPYQGHRFPATQLRCPRCGIRLRRRKRGTKPKTKRPIWLTISNLCYLPHGDRLYFLEREEKVRERIARASNHELFKDHS